MTYEEREKQYARWARSKFGQRAREFHKELQALEEKHGIHIGHEDSQGAFIYFDAKDMTNTRHLYERNLTGIPT